MIQISSCGKQIVLEATLTSLCTLWPFLKDLVACKLRTSGLLFLHAAKKMGTTSSS